MMFKIEETNIVFRSVNFKKDSTFRSFPAIELPMVVSVMGKIQALADAEGKISPGEHDLEFSSQEKVFVKNLVNEQDWMAGDAQFVLNVLDRLS